MIPDNLGPQKGVLLVNLGSPDSPQVNDVRAYLNQFLMDPFVLDLPLPIRRLVVSAFILLFRPRESAEAYQEIWSPNGSPLVVIAQRVQARLQQDSPYPVAIGMRYGQPAIKTGLQNLLEASGQDLEEVILVPLFPHYAMSTRETILSAAFRGREELNAHFRLTVIPPFYNHPDYIQALVASTKGYLDEEYDHLLFSYHGLPERHIRKTDPTGNHCLQGEACCTIPSPAHATCYRHQVLQTTAAFVNQAGILEGDYSIAFQSRLGRDPWLRPFTEDELARLARSGVRNLFVICPAFVSDCLETLEEIGLRGREIFLQAGGSKFTLIPCLNDHPMWIQALQKWCR